MGFTLIEIAIAMFVISLAIGTLMAPLVIQVEQRQVSETQKALTETREALIGFAVANKYLPCPDKTTAAGAGTANDGKEDVVALTGQCVVTEGNVPWVTLSTPASDPWNNRFRYKVTAVFAQRSPAATFSLASAGLFTVTCPAPGCSPASDFTVNAPAVILSHGKNGYGGINAITATANAAPTSVDELGNTDGNLSFNSRVRTAINTGAGEFDDLVDWISPNVLFNRMVTAGNLP